MKLFFLAKVSIKVKFNNKFNENLKNSTSDEYKYFSKNIFNGFFQVFKNSTNKRLYNNINGIENIHFERGSIISIFEIVFLSKTKENIQINKNDIQLSIDNSIQNSDYLISRMKIIEYSIENIVIIGNLLISYGQSLEFSLIFLNFL